MALYLWDTKNEKWEKPEVEGTLFVYRFVLNVYYLFFGVKFSWNYTVVICMRPATFSIHSVKMKNFSRSVSPKYGFTIMNRLSIGTFNNRRIFLIWKMGSFTIKPIFLKIYWTPKENLNEEITPEINVHINTPFLLYQSKKNPARPRGIWFFSQVGLLFSKPVLLTSLRSRSGYPGPLW